jgi:hypothetical protein
MVKYKYETKAFNVEVVGRNYIYVMVNEKDCLEKTV